MSIVRIGNRVFSFSSDLAAEGFKEGIGQGESIEVCLARFHGVEITPKEKESVKKSPLPKSEPHEQDDPEDDAPAP